MVAWDHATKDQTEPRGMGMLAVERAAELSGPPFEEEGWHVAAGGSGSTRGGRLSARASARLAWSLCGLALALLAATLLVLLAGRPPATAIADQWQRQAADLLTFVGPPLLGGLIAARRPDNRYGWLWLAVGLVMAVQAFVMAYASVAQAASITRLARRWSVPGWRSM
jgi:hypothetical protein